jgi:hypothetical protein
MKGLTLRELINRLEELSHNGRNDDMPVEIHVTDLMEHDRYGQPETAIVTNAFIDQWNNCGTFDESDDSYEYIGLIAHP